MQFHGRLVARFALFLSSYLLLSAGVCEARIEAEALIGSPFGVGRISISGLDIAIDSNQVMIEEKNGRVFYPAATQGVLGRLLGQILGDATDRPAAGITIYFLFRGPEPLDLTVYTPRPLPLALAPRGENQRVFERQLTQWWRQYNAHWRQLRAEDNHPPLVPTYLTAMLAQRMGLEPPLLERLTGRESNSETTRSLQLLLGLEQRRLEIQKNTMLGQGDFGEPANLPLPPDIDWAPLPLPASVPSVEVEPIARVVPPNWFYVRYGKFANYVWMDNLIEEHGGDIGSMVTLRSFVPPMGTRTQGQLGLEKSVLGQILGDTVIADVAIVGRDTFTKEGGAFGVLFHAKNTSVLKNDLSKQRLRALDRAKPQGATAETLQIAGQDVSFYSTPDNRLRSFHAVNGDFHLVTTSRAMVEQFLSLQKGGSLGESAEFRYARQALPTSRKDSIFVYFSSAFFEGLLSPHYQVELERRMKSVTDMELLMLARLAARGEGVPGDSMDHFVAAGLLPPGFGRRPDGSGPVLSDAALLDSRRGARGTFIPIPDVKIRGITASEAARLQSLNAQLAQEWRRMDPVLVGIQRFALDEKDRERVVIDANMLPIDEGKYGWVLSMLGPPTRQMITTASGDVIAAQAVLRGGLLVPSVPPHHLFLGVQDIPPAWNSPPSGLLQIFNMLRSTPGYLGSWPRAGFLDLLPLNLGGSVPDPNGFSRLPLGLWRRQGAGFSVLSFDPGLLANVTPQLRVAETENEAQLRVHVEDLSQSKVRPWITNLYYQRGLAASAGNPRLLLQLNQQLHVPPEKTLEVAEELLDGHLICPLGGKYELVEDLNGGARLWRSTAWPQQNASSTPEGFEAPLLKWFRGLDVHLTKTGDQIVAHAELDLQRTPSLPKIELPFFNLFGGGQKALQPKPNPKAEELPPPLPPVANPPKNDSPGPREL